MNTIATKFLDGRAVQIELEKYVRKSKLVRFAVAFWGDGAPSKLGLLGKRGNVEIVCNLKMGGTNPEVIEALIKSGFVVSQSDHLHGKVYLFDDTVILGSSNASANGLSFQNGEIEGWHEANLVTADPIVYRDASAWFEKLPRRAISHDDIERAKEAWSRRRKVGFGQAPPSRQTLIDAIKSSPEDFSRTTDICLSLFRRI
jgi:phosphatidylserine/phosphatidylglycerophosphate/cardiolipin synthase-like enzyme